MGRSGSKHPMRSALSDKFTSSLCNGTKVIAAYFRKLPLRVAVLEIEKVTELASTPYYNFLSLPRV